jgi:hypothetical protein
MAEEKTVVERYRKSPFVLDKPKLARMLDIMEQRFAEAQLDFKPTFGITLKKGRQIKTGSMDQLLGFDNSVSNPITGLVIIADSYSGGPPEKNLFAKLDFDNTSRPIISLEVISSDSKRAAQSFAELEEQVERTLVMTWMHKINANTLAFGFGILFLAFIFTAIAFLPSDEVEKSAVYLLSKEERAALSQQAKSALTTDEKVNFLFALQTRQLERSAKPSGTVIRGEDLKRLFSLKVLFISLPIILVISCLIYLRRKAYPKAVFVWGDWEEHYARILSIRKTILTVIILSIFIGVLSNLFVYALVR